MTSWTLFLDAIISHLWRHYSHLDDRIWLISTRYDSIYHFTWSCQVLSQTEPEHFWASMDQLLDQGVFGQPFLRSQYKMMRSWNQKWYMISLISRLILFNLSEPRALNVFLGRKTVSWNENITARSILCYMLLYVISNSYPVPLISIHIYVGLILDWWIDLPSQLAQWIEADVIWERSLCLVSSVIWILLSQFHPEQWVAK